MPRVLFIDQSANLGGAELSLLSIAENQKSHCRVVVLTEGAFLTRLKERAINTALICLPEAVLDIRRGAQMFAVLKAAMALIPAVARLASLARRYDVVYANTQKAFVLAAIAGRLARRPVIWHLRDILDETHFSRTMIKVAVRLFNHFGSRLIANSEATAQAFIAAGGDPSRVTVIWNGIDTQPFQQICQSNIAAFRASLHMQNATLVGVFSRVSPWKGQHVLIEALQSLPEVQALIVGEVLFGEEAYAAHLRKRARECGVADRVHFLGFRHDIPLIMRSVDIVVHTSTSPEPFGRVIVEGMLAGKPVIATVGGGTGEIITNGVNGVLVPPGDSNALAASIRELLPCSPGKKTLLSNARQRAMCTFSLPAMLNSVAREVTEIGGANPSKATHVLFVDQSGDPGGAELCLLDLVQHMRSNCRVALMSDGSFRGLLEKARIDYDLIHVPSAVHGVRRESGILAIILALPGVVWSAFRLVRLAAKADVVYANTQKAFVIGALSARIARRPLIWHLHDILSEAHFSRISTRIVVWLSNRLASRIIANSKATAAALIKAGGDPGKIEVIWNGIDCAPYDGISAAEVSACRASLNVGNAPLIGLFGRLAVWKGQHVLIDALQDLPGVHALIVGEELYADKGYGNELMQRARDHGVSQRVHFLGFRQDIPLLMQSVDVIVHTSTAPEPFGRVIVEGMLAGRPVIAAAGGGPEEIIENGISGLIVPPADSGALATAVSSVLKPSPWRERMVENAKSRAHQLFSSEAMIRSIEKMLYIVSNEHC